MIITDSAKARLQEILLKNNMNCLKVKLQQSCCGTGLFFQMAKLSEHENATETANGIPLVMEAEVTGRTKEVTLDFANNELVINDPSSSSCGC